MWPVARGACGPCDNLLGHLPTEMDTTLIRRAGGGLAAAGSWGPSAVPACDSLASGSGGLLGQVWDSGVGARKGKASGVCQARGRGMGWGGEEKWKEAGREGERGEEEGRFRRCSPGRAMRSLCGQSPAGWSCGWSPHTVFPPGPPPQCAPGRSPLGPEGGVGGM